MRMPLGLLLAVTVALAGCATRYDRLGRTLDEIRPELGDSYGFSFRYGADRYFFAPQNFKQDGRECLIWLGFKNEILTSAFPLSVFSSIERDYREHDDPESIKKLIVDRIASERPDARKCHDVGSGPPPDSGQGIGLMILLFPISIPFTAFALTKRQIDVGHLRSVTRALKLGMPRDDLPDFIARALRKKTKGSFEFYEYEKKPLRLILYFRDGLLDAWSQTDLSVLR